MNVLSRNVFLICLLSVSLNAFSNNTTLSPEECLALNIYHEARSESLAGQYAVADVVLNRVDSKRYPNTVCEVVFQANYSEWWLENHNKEVPILNQCQFSWYCDGKPDDPMETDAWQRSAYIAISILKDGRFRGITEGATHYHTQYVNPFWNANMLLIGTIGDHIFYLEK